MNIQSLPHFKNTYLFLFGEYGCFIWMPACTPHASGAHQGQVMDLDALEMDLHMVISHLVGAEKSTLDPLEEQLVLWTPEPSLQPCTLLSCFTVNYAMVTWALEGGYNCCVATKHLSPILLRDGSSW